MAPFQGADPSSILGMGVISFWNRNEMIFIRGEMYSGCGRMGMATGKDDPQSPSGRDNHCTGCGFFYRMRIGTDAVQVATIANQGEALSFCIEDIRCDFFQSSPPCIPGG